MKCLTCGNDNPADAQFCGGCGVSLSISTSSGIGIATAELPMVSFPQAINLGFKNYFKFSGRATRAEYWWWLLFVVLVTVIPMMAFPELFSYISWLVGLAAIVSSLALGARRLHDINRTGWWLLLLCNVIGWIVLIVWAIKRGDQGPNRYGPDPRQTKPQHLLRDYLTTAS